MRARLILVVVLLRLSADFVFFSLVVVLLRFSADFVFSPVTIRVNITTDILLVRFDFGLISTLLERELCSNRAVRHRDRRLQCYYCHHCFVS